MSKPDIRTALHAKGFRPDGKGGLVRLPAVEWSAKYGTPVSWTPVASVGGDGIVTTGVVRQIPAPDWTRDAVEIVLPLPGKELRPRARVHYMAKARVTKAYRALAAMEARVVCGGNPPRWERATVLIQWFTTRAATVDPDAVVSSMKSALDGLQDAGVVLNDRALFPERPEILTRQPWSKIVLTVRALA